METNQWLSNKKSPSFGWGYSCKFYTWGYNVQGKVQFILFILHLKKSWMFETHFIAVGKVSVLILYDIVLGHGSMVVKYSESFNFFKSDIYIDSFSYLLILLFKNILSNIVMTREKL